MGELSGNATGEQLINDLAESLYRGRYDWTQDQVRTMVKTYAAVIVMKERDTQSKRLSLLQKFNSWLRREVRG